VEGRGQGIDLALQFSNATVGLLLALPGWRGGDASAICLCASLARLIRPLLIASYFESPAGVARARPLQVVRRLAGTGCAVSVEVAVLMVILVVRFLWASRGRLLEGRVDVGWLRLRMRMRIRIVWRGEVVWSRAVLQRLRGARRVRLLGKRTRWYSAELLQPRVYRGIRHDIRLLWVRYSSAVGVFGNVESEVAGAGCCIDASAKPFDEAAHR
jgi:hypothetical protein